MKGFIDKIVILVALLAMLPFVGCQEKTSNYVEIHPYHKEKIEGTEFSKLDLTEKAVERLVIQTAVVAEEMIAQSPPQPKKVIPYAAVIYGAHGETWVYTNPEPRVFIRDVVKVDYVENGKAVLSQGPPTGTSVVTQGAAELYGTEFSVGH